MLGIKSTNDVVVSKFAVGVLRIGCDECRMAFAHYENLTPLAAPNFKLDGADLVGDPIITDAIRRWRKGVVGVSYEDFLRRAYLREALLMDAYVCSMATDMPLTEDEVMATDPYELAIFYPDTDTYSKSWDLKPPERKPMATARLKRV